MKTRKIWSFFKRKTNEHRGHFFDSIFNDRRDPFDDQLDQQIVWKALVFLLFFCPLLYSSGTRIYALLWFAAGISFVSLRIFLSCRAEQYSRIFGREMISAWRTGELTGELLFFWPLDLLITIGLLLFGKTRKSFSEEYRNLRFNAYMSGGRFYGVHVDTAQKMTDEAIALTVTESEHIAAQARKQSYFVVVYSALISFLCSPYNFLRNNHYSDGKENHTVCFFEQPGVINAVASTILEMIRKLREFFSVLSYFLTTLIIQPFLLRWFLPPIRYIPIFQDYAHCANQINAPPWIIIH